MPLLEKPPDKTLLETIRACIGNGRRLEEESADLEFREPPALQLYVLLIAQEEFAKAFILHLIRADIIPFNQYILRAMNDHTCKQLVGLIMDYVNMKWDTLEEMNEMIRADVELGDSVPPAVESAISLLRFEKVGRWESRDWEWKEPPVYEATARQVAKGGQDRRKQDALYVRIGKDGRVVTPPTITSAEIYQEKDRLSDFRMLVESLVDRGSATYRYDTAIAVLKAMFAERI
jgi:hypothetical protein